MDSKVEHLDDDLARALEQRAVLEGRTIAALISEAIRAYLIRPSTPARTASLRDLKPEAFPEGAERLSEEIDDIVYRGRS